jgi:hypothetical protein
MKERIGERGHGGTPDAPQVAMKITVRRVRLAWKYRRYRKLWNHRFELGALLTVGGMVAAGILLRPGRILKSSEQTQ